MLVIVSEGAVVVSPSANPSDTAHSVVAGGSDRKEERGGNRAQPLRAGAVDSTPATAIFYDAPTDAHVDHLCRTYWPETTRP